MSLNLTKQIAKIFYRFKSIPYVPILIDEQIKVFTMFFNPDVFMKMMEFVQTIKRFDNVASSYHKYGGVEFRVNNKEFCHIHGDGLVDILLNKSMATDLINNNEVEDHHVIKGTGWVSFPITKDDDITSLIDVVKKAYNLRN